jgi:hypothetical protein
MNTAHITSIPDEDSPQIGVAFQEHLAYPQLKDESRH